ncbi:hypothetical protein N7528_007952 [Penicillium herquei]|nr:hypothetical protein N7528_007952 [Penicillium herquei]
MPSHTTTLPTRPQNPYRINKRRNKSRLIISPNSWARYEEENVVKGTQNGDQSKQESSYWDNSAAMEDGMEDEMEFNHGQIRERPKKAIKWDPEVSYVGMIEDAKKMERPQRAEKLWTRQNPPILKRENIPFEWNWTEADDDLDPKDYDAQIERCHERIHDGILPVIFEHRLAEMTGHKERQDKILAKYPGKSLNVAYRLETLHRCLDYIKKNPDEDAKYKQRKNVKALIEAYNSGHLEWSPRLVTYWSHGKQLCQPRPFDWDEAFYINKKHEGWEGFWVEGLDQPEPQPMCFNAATFPGSNDSAHMVIQQYIRIPGSTDHVRFGVYDDTGASTMALLVADIDTIVAAGGGTDRPPLMGMRESRLADGSIYNQYLVAVEVAIENMRPPSTLRRVLHVGPRTPAEFLLPHWTPALAVVRNDPHAPRLAGPWIRDQLYVLSIPDGERNMYIFDEASGLSRRHYAPHIQRAGTVEQRRDRPRPEIFTSVRPLPKGVDPLVWPNAPAFAPIPIPVPTP